MIPLRIDMTEYKFPTVRAWREATKATWNEVGKFYHLRMLPRHFQAGAASRYGYRPRTAGYKRRSKPNQPSRGERLISRGKALPESLSTPLVLTGLLRKSILANAVVRPFPTRATIYMVVPSYVPQRQRTLTQPPVANEATRITSDEGRVLREILLRGITRRLKEANTIKKTRIAA